MALRDSLIDADVDRALVAAANSVFGASGEDIYLDDFRGYVRAQDVDALVRVAQRSGWPAERTPWRDTPNFVRDRFAYVAHRHLIGLAHDFAEHNPDAIGLYLDREEADYRERGFSRDRYYHEALLRLGPAHSIVRDWAGGSARSHLAQDVRDLRALVYEALNALRKAGALEVADAIEKRLTRHGRSG